MSFEEWSNNKKKKKTSSFEEWSNAERGVSKNQEEEDERKRQAYLSSMRSNDDIAPVREKGGNKDSIFKSGGFSDGVDGVGDFFGDLGETILGTTADLGIGMVKGVGRMAEGLVDLGTYGVAKAADALGADEFAEKARKTARYSATDEWTKDAQNFVDQYSVLGNKADMVSEGLGQVAAVILTGGAAGAAGLGSAGVAAVTTGVTGLSAMGTNMGEAYDSGATDKDAFLYGLGTGAIEAGTELLFGGLGKGVKALGISRGIGGLDDIFAKKLSSKIVGSLTNESVQKALGNTVEYAVKSSGEGFEEVLSGVGSAVMKKLTYEDDESLKKLIADENLLEQFVVGAVTSSIAQGGDFIKSTKRGTDLVTGQTAADEKVVSKVVEDEIARREAAGEKLTDKEKNKIYDSVIEQMEHGQIDIDTIEKVLGGDAYKAFNDYVNSEENVTRENLKAELDELRKMKNSDMNDLQTERMNELKGMNLDDTTKRDGLRKTLDDTLSPMLQNSKLSESYRERERRKQKFEADLSKYTGKQRESVERAIKSGVLNNTYRSHEFVDILSKIEAEKGIVFDYTDNEKLKESGFAVEGVRVNGYADKNKGAVTLNVESRKAWQSVVGHEITHVLENTEAYSALRESLFAYANSKGELESRRASLTNLYRNMDADIEAELTADLVGDYLFSDKAFVNHLTGNESLFRKIYEEIKYLCKVATGKELTEIEKVKHEFDRVWKEYSNSTEDVSDADDSGEADIDYSVSVTDKDTLDSLNEQVARGEYDPDKNPDGGYYVTYKSMSFWGYDDEGNAILRSPMAEYVDGELSNAYLVPKDKSKLNWYQATETIDENTGLPSGLLVKTKQEGKKSFSYLPASENQDLINEDWSNLYFNLRKKILKNGKWVNSDVPARYNPYEHSSNSMLNDQFTAAYQRDNLVTVKMYVPLSEDNGAYRAKWSKDPTGWSDWKSGIVAGKIGKQKDLQRRVYLSRYAAPVEIVPDSEVAQAYKGYLEGTDVAIPDNVVSPNLLNELKKAGVPIEESGKVQYSISEIVDENNNSYGMGVKLDSTLLDNLTPDERIEMVKERVKELGGSTFTAYDNNGNAVDVTIAKSSRTFKNKNGRRVSVNKDLTTKYNKNETKQEAVVLVDELIETAHYLNSDPAKHPHDWLDNNGKNDWERWTTYIEDKNNTIWEATLNVANATNGEKILYDISPIKKVGRSGKSDAVPTDKSVPQNPDIVNTQMSISSDSEGKQLSEGQIEYFADSKIRDENGNLKVMYHGTPNGDFTVFRDGTYFTENKWYADLYQNPGASSLNSRKTATNPKTFKVYLDIKKPFDISDPEARDIYINEYIKGGNAVGINPYMSDAEYAKISSIDWTEGEDLREFLVDNGYDYDGLVLDEGAVGGYGDDVKSRGTSYVVFNPEQVKDVENKNPTSDPDIRFSLSPETDADYMSAVERGDTETAQRMVDEAAKNAGYTRKLYHGTASKFNVFGFGRTGIFTTDNFDMAKTYGNNVMSLYGKEGAKVLHIDAKESPHWSIEVSKDVLDFSEYPLMRGKERYSTNDISLIAFREGYDVVVIDNVYDNYSAASGNTENGLGTDVVYKDPNQVKSSEAITYDDNGNVIPLSQRFNTDNDDIRYSISNKDESFAPVGNYSTPFRELALEEDIAPVAPTKATEAPSLADIPVLPDEPVAEEEPVKNVPPMPESDEEIIKTVKERLNAKITNSATELEETKLLRDWVKASYENKIEKLQTTLDSKKNKDTKVAIALRKRIANLKRVSADVDADIQKRISDIESRISKTAKRMEEPPKKDILEVRYERIDKQLEEDKIALEEDFDKRKVALWEATQDKTSYISNKALDLYNEVKSMRKGVRVSGELGYLLDNLDLSEEHKSESYKRLRQALIDIKNRPNQTVNQYSEIESIAREMLNSSYEDAVYDLDDMDNQYQEDVKRLEADAEAQKKAIREQAEALHRADVQRQKLEEVNSILHSKGFDLDEMLDNPDRQLSTFETVDTMPQRVMEKTFGYEAGQALADATVNKVAQNESAGLKWLDSITNRKNGLLAQLSKQYDIKPHSKEIAAAMMYGEGSWVDEKTGEEFAYGDAELAKDFPDAKVQNNIKALVRDPRIRQFYDETLDAINKARKRNGYPEIPRRANYFLHYRELGDFFTKHGLPFNPNDARAKDLPTDMVGRTADLKPGQPFFTSSWQRKGKKTSYDLFEGMERYANSAKNQIYHIDDIQTLRALHYHLAERFGQAQGLENLNKLTPEQASEQIKKVYGSHLSTFAAFLDTEANILAGKTSMIDRALSEGMLGRRILTFMDALNQQTGATMVGYNVSSANTNWLPVVREFANSNPVDSVKALAQTVANIASRGKLDSFREDSTVYIRRQGADRFNRKLWQKMQDPAYALMGAVDSISTEIIARTEYNKAIREGMNPQQAHYESDKKVSRLMADRSLGQMPQMYTSRVMGLITKFQLEVRNDMDSMFYDTIQEEKLSRKDIENARERNAKTAAKVAWRYGATAIALHAFGQAFEAVAGYNPAFDIIEAIVKTFGWDDDEDDEDTWRDNLGEGAMSLLEDLPYAGIVLDGGRIPISSALPDLKGIIEGKDEYGNDKSAIDHIKEIAPYMLPAGGNQLKKSIQGLKMFSDKHPVTGSYTDSGSLRFPVEKTPLNVAQAALFGQYASKNAREYFDNDYAPLKAKQIQEYIDVDMPIKDYWEYREGLNDIAPLPGKKSVTLEQKLDYVDSMDLPTRKKNILVNNLSDRKDPIDMTSYGDYGSLEEFDFATDKPEKYAFAKSVGGYSAYKTYSDALYDIKGDKDASGKTINGSRKAKVLDYINNLDADYYTKILLWKSEYPSDDSYDYEIVEYLNNRSDLTYTDRVNALTELGFRVTADGQIYVD